MSINNKTKQFFDIINCMFEMCNLIKRLLLNFNV